MRWSGYAGAAAWLGGIGLCCCGPAGAQTLRSEAVTGVSGASTAAAHPPGDFSALYFLTWGGAIYALKDGAVRPTPFLNITPLVSQGGEIGALGFAFDPDYATNGFFYLVHSTHGSPGSIVLVRYRVSATDPNVADPASRYEMLSTIATPVHNAGWIAFGPDGYLYLARGDGGPGGVNNPQNPGSLLGKILRLDTSRDDFPADPGRNYGIPAGNPFAAGGGAPEVWALGFRNPWRCSFDRQTGELWIGDVGDAAREEVNRQPSGVTEARNYGWPCLEGTAPGPQAASASCADTSGFQPPFFEQPHPESRCVVGGYVYRGCAIPWLRGRYVFASCAGGRVWSFDPADPASTLREHTQELGTTGATLFSFAEDAYGELYLLPGPLKILPGEGEPMTDCNGNGRPDACDIADGTSEDANGNGVPDQCDGGCAADFDTTSGVQVADIFAFLRAWFANSPSADFDGQNGIQVADIFAFLRAWFAGC